MKTTVSLILNYNSSNETIRLYEQLKEFYPTLALIIIDNLSNKKDVENLKRNINKENLILNNKNLGYAGGNNIGISKAIELGFKYVWILNPDISVNKDTLPKLLNTVKKEKKIAAVGPRICFRNDKNKIYSDGGIIDFNTYKTFHINTNKEITKTSSNILEVDYVNGSTILLNIEAIKSIGMLYEPFFLYYEETEWCLRAKKDQWKVQVNPNSVAYHLSSEKTKTYYYYMFRNRLLLAKIIKTDYGKIKKVVFKEFLRELKRSIKNKKISAYFFVRLKGVIDAIKFKI